MQIVKPILRLLVANAVAATIPAATWACSSCMITDPKNAHIYLGMTLMMSSLPIFMVGWLAYWLRRYYA
jgi:hypothetical protein